MDPFSIIENLSTIGVGIGVSIVKYGFGFNKDSSVRVGEITYGEDLVILYKVDRFYPEHKG